MKIIIEGAGEVGSHLAKMLRSEENEVTVIDNDEGRLNALISAVDAETITGNPCSLDTLREANADKADLFIAVMPFCAQEINITGALLAKKLGAAKVIARVNEESCLKAENKLLYKELGIDLLFYPEKGAADEIVSALYHTTASETMDFARGKLQVSIFKLDEDSSVLDLKLREFILSLPEEERREFRIIAISRESGTIIPDLDSKFRFGDQVFTVSTKEGAGKLAEKFGKNTISVKNVMIMGGTPIAEMVARTLHKQDKRVTIIERDRNRCIELSDALPEGISIVNGDGRNSDLLFDEGIRDCDAFVSLTGSDESNILSCVMAKKYGVQRTIAEIENFEYIRLAEEMGVDNVINKKLISAGRIFRFTLSNKARYVRYLAGTDAELIEYTVPVDAPITTKCIKDINMPSGAIICGLYRGDKALIVVGDTIIESYDRVAIFALPQSTKALDRLFKAQ